MISKMRIKLVNCFFIILVISCSNKVIHTPKLEAFEVSMNLVTTVEKANSLIEPGNKAVIVSFGDKMLYIFEIKKVKTKEIKNEKGLVIDHVDETLEVANQYFVSYANQKKGLYYCYSTSRPRSHIRFDVDSLLKGHGLNVENLKSNQFPLGRHVQTIAINNNIVLEKYVNNKKSSLEEDSIYRYFDKSLKHAPFSLSDSLDKARDSKLVKTVHIYNNPVPMPSNLKHNPKLRSYYWELKRVSLNNTEETLRAFKDFEKDSKIMK